MGRADDPAEREADEMAALVTASLRRSTLPPPAPDLADRTRAPETRIRRAADTGDVGRVARVGGPSGRIRRSSSIIRRDVGFELETKNVTTKRANTGGALPAVAYPDEDTADAAWNAPTATRLAKADVIASRPDIEVTADDYPGVSTTSDLEVVTTHFPETPAGRGRIIAGMTALNNLIAVHDGLLAAGVVNAEALHGQHGFTTQIHDAMLGGRWSTATTAPQVTMGVRVGNVADIVRDLHGAPGETGPEKATRDPGRLRMRRPDPVNVNEPRALGPTEEAQTLINSHALAQASIASYGLAHPAAPAGAELEGILTVVYTYCEGVQHKQTFLKNHTPLMAKTDLATIWTTLPAPVQQYYGETDMKGRTRFERLVAEAPGYPARMSQPLMNTQGLDDDNKPAGQQQWYHKLTLQSWLRGIALRSNTPQAAIRQFFTAGPAGSLRRGVDQLSDANFPSKPAGQEVEGYGVLGAQMDTGAGGVPLPVFELRSPSRPITFANAQQWMLDVFDYVVSLNANPGGGYQHMV